MVSRLSRSARAGEGRCAPWPRPLGRRILLGSEGHGLPASVLERAKAVAIETAEGIDSLNLAVASGIALHHLAFGKDERPC